MALERTALGSPTQGLQKARQVNPNQTAGVLSQLSTLGQGVAKEYRETQKLNMSRKAQTDAINKQINPDLKKSSAVYAGKTLEYEQTQVYNTWKSDIQAGKYDDTDPEAFQQYLEKQHRDTTKTLGNKEYSDLMQEIHAGFWFKNEGNLVAAQRGMATAKLKKNQENLFLSQTRESFQDGMTAEQTADVIAHLMQKGAGDLVSNEHKKTVLTVAAGLQALTGDDTILAVLDDKYNISIDPKLAPMYKAARKSFASSQKDRNDAYSFTEMSNIDNDAEAGILTEAAVIKALDDPKVKITPLWAIGKMNKSRRRATELDILERNIQRILSGKAADLTGMPKSDVQTMHKKIFEEHILTEKDPEIRGQRAAVLYGEHEQPPEILKNETHVFSDFPMLTAEGEINPAVMEAFSFFNGMKKSPAYTTEHFNRIFEGNKEALRNFHDLEFYAKAFTGSQADRMKFAGSKIEALRETKEQVDPQTVSVKYNQAVDSFDDALAKRQTWKFWQNTSDESMRNMYHSQYLRAVKNELRMGRPLEAAQETAFALVDNQYTFGFGQMQYTGGVSAATRGGFRTTEACDQAFDIVTTQDPEVKEMLTSTFGSTDLTEQSIYFDADTNNIIIGGDTEAAVSFNIETLKAKHELYEERIQAEYKEERKLSAEAIADRKEAQRLLANDKLSKHLLNLEMRTITKSPWGMEERASSKKFEYILNRLPGVYSGMTYDKYKELDTDSQTDVRKLVNHALASTVAIAGISTPWWKELYLTLSNRQEEITPHMGLWSIIKSKFNFGAEAEASPMPVGQVQETDGETSSTSDLIEPMKYEENRGGTGKKDGKWFPFGSVEGGTDTIAYGHKLTKAEVKAGTYKDGITEEEATALLKKDLEAAESTAKKSWTGYTELPNKYQQVIKALAFNIGSVTKAKWPNLADAMKAKDDSKVRAEMITSFTTASGTKKQLTARAKRIADEIGLGA